jgi:hypothetical protein
MVDSIEEGKMRLKPQSLERRRETRRTRKEERRRRQVERVAAQKPASGLRGDHMGGSGDPA